MGANGRADVTGLDAAAVEMRQHQGEGGEGSDRPQLHLAGGRWVTMRGGDSFLGGPNALSLTIRGACPHGPKRDAASSALKDLNCSGGR